jgi:molybdate transport system substrate-binding protein
MTSGAFAEAYRRLIPELERLTQRRVVTLATSVGSGETYIPSRLARGEVADLVIVADALLRECLERGLVLAEGGTPLARSAIGMAVRAGAPAPDISTLEALKRTLLAARSIGCSASVSGQYLVAEVFPRLGIADEVARKARRIGNERIGAVIARGEVEVGFEQMSELLPVPGIAHVTPLPPGAQKVTTFSAGVAASSAHPALAREVIAFLASPAATHAIAGSGLEPATAST